MNWKLPNQLTVGRIGLAGGFFVLTGLYEPGGGGTALLNAALVVYIIAAITDVLDGYLARKMNVTSAFGRIADPFVDKLLVVGAFAMFTGSNFIMPDSDAGQALPQLLTGNMQSGVHAWMTVVIIAREFVVSAVRGYSESCGVKFPATYAGKIKMFVQSLAICVILFQMANMPDVLWAIYVKVILVWLAVVITVVSGLAYVGKARRLLIADE
jgi:CDP-diacylglycerol--glycerol-3-phosphate 3-phosphatidyltransferase